jgi:peroxiredoxin
LRKARARAKHKRGQPVMIYCYQNDDTNECERFTIK